MTEFFGIPISTTYADEVRATLRQYLLGEAGKHIVTANPEILLSASHDELFYGVLSDADLIVADGIGLIHLSYLLGKPIPERVTGMEIIDMSTDLAFQLGMRVLLLGGEAGEASEAAMRLAQQFPNIAIHSIHGGVITRAEEGWRMDSAILDEIRAFEPQVLFVALGAPKQEIWIREHLADLPSVRVAVGVGGAFAFLSDRISRAPKWMQKYGIEWAWRVWKEPRRIGRIFNAVIVFPIMTIWHRFFKKRRISPR